MVPLPMQLMIAYDCLEGGRGGGGGGGVAARLSLSPQCRRWEVQRYDICKAVHQASMQVEGEIRDSYQMAAVK